MEPVSFIVGLLTIVGTGALTKVGENITDATSTKIHQLRDLIQRKLPHSQTAKSLAAGQELDPQQTIIDVEPIERDPEVTKLLAEIEALIAQNSELKSELDRAVSKVTNNTQINRDRSQNNQFNASIQNLTINQTSHPD